MKLLVALVVAAIGLLPAHAAAQSIIDNSANATILANRAQGLLGANTTLGNSKSALSRRRSRQNSPLGATTSLEAECGGLAIGNVRSDVGDHRTPSTTVIITGNVINTGNSC